MPLQSFRAKTPPYRLDILLAVSMSFASIALLSIHQVSPSDTLVSDPPPLSKTPYQQF